MYVVMCEGTYVCCDFVVMHVVMYMYVYVCVLVEVDIVM